MRWLPTYIGLVLFALIGQMIERFTGLDPGWIAPVAGAAVLVAAALAVLAGLRASRVFFLVFALGAFAEVIGMQVGQPFGTYTYTDRWWPTLALGDDHRFPLLMPVAWSIMVLGAVAVVSAFFGRPAVLIVGGAMLAAAIDVPMEFVMVEALGYWTWENGLTLSTLANNAIGWVSVGSATAYLAVRDPQAQLRNPGAAWVLGWHGVFVLGTGLLHGIAAVWALVPLIVLAFVAARRLSLAMERRQPS